tara:strand:- start:487 stop:813 length:327 start_codon:yes stop_codon:yes gene_type:complete
MDDILKETVNRSSTYEEVLDAGIIKAVMHVRGIEQTLAELDGKEANLNLIPGVTSEAWNLYWGHGRLMLNYGGDNRPIIEHKSEIIKGIMPFLAAFLRESILNILGAK